MKKYVVLMSVFFTLSGLHASDRDAAALKQKENPSSTQASDTTTSLWVAQSPQIAQRLLDNNANVHETNEKGESLLHAVVAKDEESYDISAMLAVFCNAGIDVNQQDKSGCTALHTLCVHNPRELSASALLLFKGADPTIRNHAQETPLEMLQKTSTDVFDFKTFIDFTPRYKQEQQEAYKPIVSSYLTSILKPHLPEPLISITTEYANDPPWEKKTHLVEYLEELKRNLRKLPN